MEASVRPADGTSAGGMPEAVTPSGERRRRPNQFMQANLVNKAKKKASLMQGKVSRKKALQREKTARELKFQVNLASSLQGDDVPSGQQPVWAQHMIHSAAVIQRSWRHLKKKRQWDKVMQKVNNTETSYNANWDNTEPLSGQEDDEVVEPGEHNGPGGASGSEAGEAAEEQAESSDNDNDDGDLDGYDPEAVLRAQQESPEPQAAQPSEAPKTIPTPSAPSPTPPPLLQTSPSPSPSPPPAPLPPPAPAQQPPEPSPPAAPLPPPIAPQEPTPQPEPKAKPPVRPKQKKAPLPHPRAVPKKAPPLAPKSPRVKAAPSVRVPPKPATQAMDVKSATEELRSKRLARFSNFLPAKDRGGSQPKVNICTTQPPMRPAGDLFTTKDPASLGLASMRLMDNPQFQNKLYVPPLEHTPQSNPQRLQPLPTASHRRLKAIKGLIQRSHDGIQKRLAVSEATPVSLSELAKWSVLSRWRVASVKALIREELFGTSCMALLKSNAAHQLLKTSTSMMTRGVSLLRSQGGPGPDVACLETSARELMGVGLLLEVVAHDITIGQEKIQHFSQQPMVPGDLPSPREAADGCLLPPIASLPEIRPHEGGAELHHHGLASARYYSAPEGALELGTIKFPKTLMQAYMHGNLLDRMDARRRRASLPPVHMPPVPGPMATGVYAREHSPSCPDSMKVKGTVVSSTGRRSRAGVSLCARGGLHLPRLEYQTVIRPGIGPCFRPLEELESPRALPRLAQKPRDQANPTRLVPLDGPTASNRPNAAVRA